jgi:hypothetical protein
MKKMCRLVGRVTRLGNRLLWAVIFLITEVAQVLGFFFHGTINALLMLTKNRLGYILG